MENVTIVKEHHMSIESVKLTCINMDLDEVEDYHHEEISCLWIKR